ncbi:hypothetical protein HIM_07538 [Hirsutella minnesotensis 3608]|uniref:Origin recognition complex subunit 2 n=1 Tax=Hirsutella minnesotensis 3608 TaxID=1043627 RepID=A0A0F8A488_9HYPO|nr:hypothetical protein HIM_07538 [Hirsutella minnesotensis 3608]
MPRRKAAPAASPPINKPPSSAKRPLDEDNENGNVAQTASPPPKRRRSTASQQARNVELEPNLMNQDAVSGTDEESLSAGNGNRPIESDQDEIATAPVAVTPRKRGRPPRTATQATTPRSKKDAAPGPETPSRAAESAFTTPKRQAADRSARKKSARVLIENVVRNGAGDNEADDDDDNDNLVREIYDSEDEEDDDIGDATDSAAATPSQTPERKRRARAKSPTPPRDLPPHERYFAHNKPGRPKTSDNTLGSLALLTHDEYFAVVRGHKDRHKADIEYLEALHAESFPQWTFELAQGFSLCLYGFGSKRTLMRSFAKHLHARAGEHSQPSQTTRKTVIVNGYTHSANLREILGCIGSAIDASQRVPASTPAAMLQTIFGLLATAGDALVLTVVVNSIDAAPLRKPGTQATLAQLAAHPRVQLVCSADTPDFPLLWDVGVRSAFNFAFHDCTTFAPMAVEVDAVDEVHELLGRKARRVNGREGVAFVLRSLPDNARNLFRLLVGEVLVAMEDEGAAGDDAAGVEYRMVYNKAVEEFICTSEMAFRTLLKEFHDHQIITSRKDAIGTELLSVPFPREELEAMLEDLMA